MLKRTTSYVKQGRKHGYLCMWVGRGSAGEDHWGYWAGAKKLKMQKKVIRGPTDMGVVAYHAA